MWYEYVVPLCARISEANRRSSIIRREWDLAHHFSTNLSVGS